MTSFCVYARFSPLTADSHMHSFREKNSKVCKLRASLILTIRHFEAGLTERLIYMADTRAKRQALTWVKWDIPASRHRHCFPCTAGRHWSIRMHVTDYLKTRNEVSADHRGEAALSEVTTWMGDRPIVY